MVSGLETALNEITLVLFTTMAPAGTFALMIRGAFALKGGRREEARAALDRYTCVPLVIALVGLVASATHLGNPANALYVLVGVGRSPLSNEVVAGVVFFGVAGIYWLTAFSERPNLSLRRAALVLIEVTGALFVTAIAFAYDAETILTWRTVYVPAALWLNALVAGPIIASLVSPCVFGAGVRCQCGGVRASGHRSARLGEQPYLGGSAGTGLFGFGSGVRRPLAAGGRDCVRGASRRCGVSGTLVEDIGRLRAGSSSPNRGDVGAGEPASAFGGVRYALSFLHASHDGRSRGLIRRVQRACLGCAAIAPHVPLRLLAKALH